MDLPRGLQEMIDEYVADALDSTGTRKTRSKPRAVTPPPLPIDDDTLIPIEIELEPAPSTDPEVVRIFWASEGNTDADHELFAQLSQQLAAGESALEALPRERAARGSVAPLPAIVDDDEVTNVVGKPRG